MITPQQRWDQREVPPASPVEVSAFVKKNLVGWILDAMYAMDG